MAVIDRLTELTRPTGEEDLLDVSYPTPRLTVTPKQAVIVAAAVVVAVAVWAVWFVQRPDPAEPALAVLPEVEETAAADEAQELVVSVVGAVEKPGLITVPPGSRVADALLAALPLLDADVTALNQAQLLVDGQQIHVPARPETPAHGGAPEAQPPAGSGLVSLNSADVPELITLAGVGEATAQSIIEHRTSVGGFTAVEQLQEVKGIGPAKFEQLKDQVSL